MNLKKPMRLSEEWWDLNVMGKVVSSTIGIRRNLLKSVNKEVLFHCLDRPKGEVVSSNAAM